MRAEQVTGPVAFHGEGPVWSAHWAEGKGLRFVDMLAGDVLSLRRDGSVERRHVGEVAACVRPRAGGGAVIAVERGFALEEPDGTITKLDELWSDLILRMNEGGCDPHGRFYCGSMASDRTPGAASLYRLDPDGSVHVVLGGVTISNGLDWSPDGSLVYYADTATNRVDVFDYDRDAGWLNRRGFVEATPGRPDGLTVDAEGGVWVAQSRGRAVHRYTPQGSLDEIVEVGAGQVTACTFGDDGLDRLYITTSRERGGTDDPAAGALFAVVPGVRGLETRGFAG